MSQPDLHARWTLLCAGLRLDGGEQWLELAKNYTTSGLAYHNLHHIADCLAQFSARSLESTNPVALEMAIWFHDVIYDPKSSENEEGSAEMAARFLTGTPLAGEVSALILATKHSEPPSTPDEALICDIDLSILGSSPSRYQAYSEAIRSEYSWVPEQDYRAGRTKVLRHFLDRASIFYLKTSRDQFESRARENLESEISQLQACH